MERAACNGRDPLKAALLAQREPRGYSDNALNSRNSSSLRRAMALRWSRLPLIGAVGVLSRVRTKQAGHAILSGHPCDHWRRPGSPDPQGHNLPVLALIS